MIVGSFWGMADEHSHRGRKIPMERFKKGLREYRIGGDSRAGSTHPEKSSARSTKGEDEGRFNSLSKNTSA